MTEGRKEGGVNDSVGKIASYRAGSFHHIREKVSAGRVSPPYHRPELLNLYLRKASSSSPLGSNVSSQNLMPMLCFHCIFSNCLFLLNSQSRKYQWGYTGIATKRCPHLHPQPPALLSIGDPYAFLPEIFYVYVSICKYAFALILKINIYLWQMRLVPIYDFDIYFLFK